MIQTLSTFQNKIISNDYQCHTIFIDIPFLTMMIIIIIDYSYIKDSSTKVSMKSKTILRHAASISLLSTLLSITAVSNQATSITASSQTSTSTASSATFDMDGVISSLILGVSANTKTIDLTTVQKFILSGDWSMSVDQGKLTNFNANFYTGPVNGANNHTHQLSNFRVNNNSPIQLSPDNSLSISGILNVGTAGNMHAMM
ncbi:MAG TPA: hypothetical protein VE573_09745 [Nitrososphaeraceae archaeon]|nr:hypothetical protein [Nitrososphaeraceae archaeon]